MALLWCDSFESYGDTNDVHRAYSNAVASMSQVTAAIGVSTTVARHGTRSVYGSNNQVAFTPPAAFSNAKVIGGAVVKITSVMANNSIIFACTNAAGSVFHWTLGNDATGKLQLRYSNGVTVRLESAAGVLQLDAWHRIEFIVHTANSTTAGVTKLYVDGTLVAEDSGGGLDLYNTSDVGSLMLYLVSGGTKYVDNWYVMDDTGGYNDAPIVGGWVVECLRADGNGNASNFVGSDADSTDNYLHVDETTQDGDTSYVQSASLNDLDQYTVSNISEETPTAVRGVRVSSVCTKTSDTSTRELTQVVRSGTTDDVGSNAKVLGYGSYGSVSEVWEQDPDTVAAWTESGINAMQIGVKVTT